MNYSEHSDFKEQSYFFFNLRHNFACSNVSVDIASANVLEIGGADGVLGGLISNMAKRVIVADTVDNHARYGGEFPRLLSEKFERNGLPINLDAIKFHYIDSMILPYQDASFDLVISRSALHPLSGSSVILGEMNRVLKPGGVAYLTFNHRLTADSTDYQELQAIESDNDLFFSTRLGLALKNSLVALELKDFYLGHWIDAAKFDLSPHSDLILIVCKQQEGCILGNR